MASTSPAIADSKPDAKVPAANGSDHRHGSTGALLSSSSLVQVAPLPLTAHFHAGKVLDVGVIPAPTQEREEAYIPVALARAQLSKVVADMHAMKAEQVQKLGEILEHYRGIEKDTRIRHEAHVRALKDRAESRLKESRDRFVELEKAGALREEFHTQEKRALREEQERLRQKHLDDHEKWRLSFECALQAHEDEFAKAQSIALDEIARVSRVAASTGAQTKQKLCDEMEMYSEDALSQAMRVDYQLHKAREDMQAQHQAFLDREDRLIKTFAANQEVDRFLRSLIDDVVDSRQQYAEQQRSLQLHEKLRALEAKAKDAGCREEVLERRIQVARERFERIESQAVRETVELLVHAVVVTYERFSHKPPATLEMPTQTEEEEGEIDMENIPEEKRVEDNPAIPALPLDKTKYESEVEVTRERNVALIRSKSALQEAKQKLDACAKQKTMAKTAVKTWLSEFQAQHGREPAIEEKAQVKAKYLAFKEAEEAYSAQKTLVATLKQQHHELALRVDASSRWSALGSAVAKSPRNESQTQEQVDNVTSRLRGSSSRSINENSSRSSLSSRPQSSLGLPDDSSRQSSTSHLQPSVLATTDSGTDPDPIDQQDEIVAALEKELQELRARLASTSAVLQSNGATSESLLAENSLPNNMSFSTTEKSGDSFPASNVQAPSSSMSTSNGFFDKTPLTDGQDKALLLAKAPNPDAKAVAINPEIARIQKLKEEAEAQARKDEIDRHQQQRVELQAEITTLSSEIEKRRTEKTRLEQEIEQLRLHLELSEARDNEDREPQLFSEAKAVDDDVDSAGTEEQNEDYSEDVEFELEESEVATAEAKDDEDEEEIEQGQDEEVDDIVEDESQDVKEDAARSLQIVKLIADAVARGKAQFNRGDKAKCYQTYAKCADQCVAELLALRDKPRRQWASVLKRGMADASRLPPARGPAALRKHLDTVQESCEQWLNAREEQAAARIAEQQAHKEAKAAAAAIKKQQSLEKKQQKAEQRKAEQREQEKKSHKKKSAPPQNADKGAPTAAGGGKALEDAKQKLRALESKAKADRVKISQFEAALAKAENQLASGGGGGGSNAAGGAGSAASDRRVADMEKKHKKALDESEKAAKKEITSLTSQLQAAQRASQALQEQASALQKELGVVGGKAKQLGQLETEVNELREQAALVAPLNNELREAKVQYATLETSYREEQTLRKKYYNQIEDMKGKIRVYARCRPMSGSELERGCISCVKFLDEFSLEVSGGSRAAKTFAYDQVFSPASSQIQVFEDTKNLLQSAVDGYNVCIFAYGQTGSGKTFTMTGCESDPGLSPRAIHHLFALADEAKSNFTISFQATMLELYNDTLIDLFYLMEGGGSHDNKLDIKKNEKGMVVVSNAMLKKCSSPEQTLRLFEAANKKRQVGATKMNAESSRSHSIFSLLVESFNKTTKTTSIGKLSLVDLAGSERAGKTGATADRLKEAQAINKSLSALGDVISALSTNEKFIPYRNNKLTQLMQDSLGGNAKTLMFVNISPADYNTEETVTSLTYASRVKLITNNANKNSESEQVNRLKAIIKQLRAGKTDVDLEGVLD